MHTVVVFHRDARDRLDEALHALSEEGIDRDHVSVTPIGAPPPEQGPRSVLGLPHGMHYGGVGAALGMVVGLVVGPSGRDPVMTIWLVIAGALLGGMAGAIVGFVVGGVRRQRWQARAPHPHLAVRVEAESRDVADRARQLLLAHGGDTEPG